MTRTMLDPLSKRWFLSLQTILWTAEHFSLPIVYHSERPSSLKLLHVYSISFSNRIPVCKRDFAGDSRTRRSNLSIPPFGTLACCNVPCNTKRLYERSHTQNQWPTFCRQCPSEITLDQSVCRRYRDKIWDSINHQLMFNYPALMMLR